MSFIVNMCSTCLDTKCETLIDIFNHDYDGEQYIKKLQSLTNFKLVEAVDMKMCWSCIRSLRLSYNFRTMCLKSNKTYYTYQRKLELNDSNKNNVTVELDDIVIKSERDDSYCLLYVDERLKPSGTVEPDESHHETERQPNYECSACGLTFPKTDQLRRHTKSVHKPNARREHKCEICGKAFKQANHLREHFLVHTGERSHKCSVCDKQFARVGSLNRHERSHFNRSATGKSTKPTPFLCNICGKTFPFSNGATRHMRIHLGEKPYECHVCKKCFSQSTHLHVHMRTHTGEKPYACDICGNMFSLNASLQKHFATHH